MTSQSGRKSATYCQRRPRLVANLNRCFSTSDLSVGKRHEIAVPAGLGYCEHAAGTQDPVHIFQTGSLVGDLSENGGDEHSRRSRGAHRQPRTIALHEPRRRRAEPIRERCGASRFAIEEHDRSTGSVHQPRAEEAGPGAHFENAGSWSESDCLHCSAGRLHKPPSRVQKRSRMCCGKHLPPIESELGSSLTARHTPPRFRRAR